MTCGNAKHGYIDGVDVRIRDAKDYHKKTLNLITIKNFNSFCFVLFVDDNVLTKRNKRKFKSITIVSL